MPGHLLITQKSEQPVAEPLKLYLDQMLRLDVAKLCVMKATMLCVPLKSVRLGQMTMRYCKKRFLKIEFLLKFRSCYC